jgi:hypothetical protein
MKNRIQILVILAFLLLVVSPALSRPADAQTRRWEFNITGGLILKENPAIVMGFAYYLLPRFIALDANIAILAGGRDDRGRVLPISLNLSLNLPLWRIVPFVSGGGGYSSGGEFVRNLGAGLKLRLGRTMGFLAEYRYFWYAPASTFGVPDYYLDTIKYSYIGIGFTRY